MQVVSALKYLNEIKPPVIHYDLKPGKSLTNLNLFIERMYFSKNFVIEKIRSLDLSKCVNFCSQVTFY